MFYKKNNSLSKMSEDNDYGQFTLIDIEDNEIGPRYKIYHIKYKNDIENNVHDDDDDDDSKKPDKNYYLENTIYSATIILAIVIFIYFG
jgi:hypothetical protein